MVSLILFSGAPYRNHGGLGKWIGVEMKDIVRFFNTGFLELD